MPKTTKKRTKKKSCSSYAEKCCICLDSIASNDRTRITSCRHRFHYSCIKKWSKRENSCPLCKRRFNWIIRNHVKEGVRRRNQADAEQSNVIQNVLWHFYNTPTFRNLISKGIYDGSRIAIALFDLLINVVSLLRDRNLDSAVTVTRQNEAHAWLDTMINVHSRQVVVD